MSTGHRLPQDFVLYNTLEDGELETRIKLGNVTAKEVTVGRGLGIKFRQLSDGNHFIQLIYDSDAIISDCEYVHDASSVEGFLDNFSRDVHELTTMYNASVVPLEGGVMPQGMRRWLNYAKLKQLCKRTHQDMRKMLKDRKRLEEEDRKRVSIRHHSSRSKRALTDYMLFPGTLWCGASDAASKYQELGLMSGTDKCCRRHDNCKNNIPGFGQRYGLFNSRPFTISECWCDRSFRTCLKRVGTSDANLVGKLFFNVVQTKCFVFKAKKTCVQRSWWGKCQRKKRLKQAILRDNMPY